MTQVDESVAEERRILKAVESFMDGWNSHDMQAHFAAFAPDADFVDVLGALLRGKQRIEDDQGRRHAARFSKSHVTTLDASVRFIRPDVAVVHHWWEMVGDAGADGRGAPPRRGIFTYVMSRHGGEWMFDAAHNSDIK